jgi:hypothetical protein
MVKSLDVIVRCSECRDHTFLLFPIPVCLLFKGNGNEIYGSQGSKEMIKNFQVRIQRKV